MNLSSRVQVHRLPRNFHAYRRVDLYEARCYANECQWFEVRHSETVARELGRLHEKEHEEERHG